MRPSQEKKKDQYSTHTDTSVDNRLPSRGSFGRAKQKRLHCVRINSKFIQNELTSSKTCMATEIRNSGFFKAGKSERDSVVLAIPQAFSLTKKVTSIPFYFPFFSPPPHAVCYLRPSSMTAHASD